MRLIQYAPTVTPGAPILASIAIMENAERRMFRAGSMALLSTPAREAFGLYSNARSGAPQNGKLSSRPVSTVGDHCDEGNRPTAAP